MSAHPIFPDPWGKLGEGETDPFPALPSPSLHADMQRADLAPPETECWRCGKSFPASRAQCPYCHARVMSQPVPVAREPEDEDDAALQPLVKVVIFFGVMLLISLVLGLLRNFGLDRNMPPKQLVQQHWLAMIVVEAVDTLLVSITLAWAGRPRPLPARPRSFRLSAWVFAAPILLVLLLLNFGYHRALQWFLNLPQLPDPILAAKGLGVGVWLVYCAQPALIEETFFRYLALGWLRDTVGVHAAVWVSAVMFGMAHVYNPVAIPYLIVLGGALGYLRVASRGLVLPVLMHFAHNALVLLMDAL